MSVREQGCTRRELLKWGVLALAGGVFAGCDPGTPAIIGSFHFIGEGMYEAFRNWRMSAGPFQT